ncbi:MAG TPA: arginine deiminase family protein, partial [Thermoplasmataceae archaeon]|nr:arginine deiminase family protein [Thermoplasmataceae archaeon]
MRIKAEWDRLRDVMIHRPGIEIEYAMLAPRPFLFERPFRTDIAIKEHENLEQTLKENGVSVKLLRNVVVDKARSDSQFRKDLEEKVSTIVKFYGRVESSKKAMGLFLKNLEIIDPVTLFHILTLEPSIDLKQEEENSVEYPTVYSNLPLANLYFMRDQQAVGPGGPIFGRMKKRQRMKEPEITRFVVEKAIGEKNTYSVGEGGIFEGGDFIPLGSFGLIGIGPRSNRQGAMEAMSSGLLDFDEIGVVTNPVYDFMDIPDRDPMVNMHLDTYFNIPGDGIVISSVELSKKAKLELFTRESKGSYKHEKETTLYDYMLSKGFRFINLRISEQLSY